MDKSTLRLLGKEYSDISKAAAEIINLNAILSLPKGTEYYFSDLHGEHEAFIHLLKSASGNIRTKIDQLFDHSIQEKERLALAELIYYPEKILKGMKRQEDSYQDWFKVTVFRLIEVARVTSEKYTRSKVRKKCPPEFAYIIDELLHGEYGEKTLYYSAIIDTILDTGVDEEFICGLCRMIRDISIDTLHILGDIFDRGPRADLILDELMHYKDVDIEWGNHDIVWMGAAAGNQVCLANVMVTSIKYNSFDFLEDGYGINLRPLSTFADQVYDDKKCRIFMPRHFDENQYDPVDVTLAAKMHKAMTVILFKLEGQLYRRHPEYGLEHRILLEKVDLDRGMVELDGKEYALRDEHFPTIDPQDPLRLSDGEQELMDILTSSFCHSEKLQEHIRFLYSKGGMYRRFNNNLLYHGCIPMTEEGEFQKCRVGKGMYAGRAYLDAINRQVKQALFPGGDDRERQDALDYMWYLWCGPDSPLFGKSKMALFEQYFVEAPETKVEARNPYYEWINDQETCKKIMKEFGLEPERGHIVNGHVPVKIGENPVKAGGKLFIIDGGISKAYQSTTGIGGYTLIYSSQYIGIVEHLPFRGISEFSSPKVNIVERMDRRVLVGDTDKGRELKEDIGMLEELIREYRIGSMKEGV